MLIRSKLRAFMDCSLSIKKKMPYILIICQEKQNEFI